MKSLTASNAAFAAVTSLALVFVACGGGGGTNGNHDGGTGGSSGAGGSGGHGGAGGSAGSGGNAGSGGAAGSGGSKGSGGSAGSGGDSGTDSPAGDAGGTKFPAGTICNKSGTKLTPPATIDHVIVFLFENENFGSVIGNKSAPYISSLATECGYASNYLDNMFSTNLVSCPHYLALTSGSNCDTGLGTSGSGCITTDDDASSSHSLSTTSIFAQASSWKAYQEDMPSNCDQKSSGNYATKHNPAAYYSTLSSCSTNDVPIAGVTCGTSPMTACGTPSNAFTNDLAAGTLPAFSFVTPNLINDMHNGLFGQVQHGDNWLYTYLPLVLQSKMYLNGQIAIFVLWDEQNSFTFGGTTPNFFISPYITAGTVASTTVNHFSSLLAFENMLGISTKLGCASGTPPGGSGSCPSGSTNDLRSAINF